MIEVPALLIPQLKNAFAGLIIQHDTTPDGPLLRKQKHHLLFTYGTLRKDFSKHKLLGGSTYLGNAFTAPSNLQMWEIKGKKRYPIIFWNNSTPERGQQVKEHAAKIYGEVYLVTPSTIEVLDSIEDNGYLYNRRFMDVYVTISNQPLYAKAWVYIGIPSSWAGVGLIRSPLITRKESGTRYYMYMREGPKD